MATEFTDLVGHNFRDRKTWYSRANLFSDESKGERVDYIEGGVTSPSDLVPLADNDLSFPGDASLTLRSVDVSMVGGTDALRVARYQSLNPDAWSQFPRPEARPRTISLQRWLKPDGTLNTEPADIEADGPELPALWDEAITILEVKLPFRLGVLEPIGHVFNSANTTNDANYEIRLSGDQSSTFGPNTLKMLWPELASIGSTTTALTGYWRLLVRSDGWTRERLTKAGPTASASDVAIEDMLSRTTFPDLPTTD